MTALARLRPAELAIYGTALAAIGASFLISPAQAHDGPVLCPFRRLTGLPCPGCGLTRSFVELAHGDPGAAFAQHPFGPLLFAALAGAIAIRIALVVARRELAPGTLRGLRIGGAVAVAAWLAWSVVRLAAAAA